MLKKRYKKTFLGIHDGCEEECGCDLEQLDSHEGHECTLNLECYVDDSFENCYWNARFEDGFELEGISGIYFI